VSAASILEANGYTQISSPAVTNQLRALPAAEVSSAAGGVNSSNSNELQIVFVLTPLGASKASSSPTLSNEVSKAGVKYSLNGDILTLTGTESEFNKLGT
jgi:hypothetical protein